MPNTSFVVDVPEDEFSSSAAQSAIAAAAYADAALAAQLAAEAALAATLAALSDYLPLIGGIMTGFITLSADPVNALHAATKQYVDASGGDISEEVEAALVDYLQKAGGTMTGYIVTHADPVSDMQVANKHYIDEVFGTIDLSAIAALQADIDQAELDINALELVDTSLDGRLDTAESTISTHTGQISSINAGYPSADAALDSRLDTLEAIPVKITTFRQTSAPTALATGDLWFDSDDSEKEYRWSGSAWISVQDGTIATNTTNITALQVIDVGGFYPGVMADAQTVVHFVANKAFTIPTNSTNSHGSARVAATSSTAFDLKKNGSSIGTITFASSATTCTFSTTQTSFAAGDTLTISGPATHDATLADICINMRGTL